MPSVPDGEILIKVEPEYLRSLADWLSHEDALRGRVRPARQPPQPGQMGGVLELLTVSLGSGGAGAMLVRSICAWLGQRRTQVSVSLKDSDGREFAFSATARNQDPAEVFAQASAMFSALRDDSGQEQAGR